MVLQKYKVCYSCGEHNLPSLLECKNCEADLTGIKVIDSAMEQKLTVETKKDDTSSSVQGELVRICECGAENPPQVRKCKVCGEDISDILPVQSTAIKTKAFSYGLKTADGKYSAVIDKPVSIIGRDAEMKEYLAEKPYVSRQHAKFIVVAEKVFVENLSRTNKTFVNNESINDGETVALNNGDEIGLGGKVIDDNRQVNAAYFIFTSEL